MFRILCSLAAVIVILNGCTAVGTLATVGATAGIAAAEDRGIEGNLRDGEITARINQL